MSDRLVLVTGGAGYVGSQSVLFFAQRGWRTVVLDDLSTGHADFAAHADHFEHGSLLDEAFVRDVFSRYDFDGVLHCAARALVVESMARPTWYYRENVVGGLNLIDAARDRGAPPIVFSSSGTIYGVRGEEAIAETAPAAPINPYGASKWVVEQLLREADRAHGLRSIALRYFNAAGADPQARVGERHEPETHLIPNVLMAPTFRVCGDDFATRDGTCLRDYVHTLDLARAHAAALEALWGGAPTDLINVGSGTGTTILEMLDAAEQVLGRSIPREVVARRPGDPPALFADISKAARVLGWTPQRSTIGVILQDALRWHRADGQTQ